MKTINTVLLASLLTASLSAAASPMSTTGGQVVLPNSCNPATSCYVKKLLRMNNHYARTHASGVLLGALYAQFGAYCKPVTKDSALVFQMFKSLSYSNDLSTVAEKVLQKNPAVYCW